MTKIDIFSGFLGAGKTTLIKKLIEEAYKGEMVVLIENEFGEIGIDGGFLKDSGIQINEMNAGCICCSLVGDFSEAIKKVVAEFRPDRIIIEPSGVGKLSDIVSAVENLGLEELELNGFATVVDAKKAKVYMKNFGEFYNNQVEHANAIILSHTAGLDEDKLESVIELIRTHNEHATIMTTEWDSLTGRQILEAIENEDTLNKAIELLEAEHRREHGHEHHHEHHHYDENDCDDPDCDCRESEHGDRCDDRHHKHEHDDEHLHDHDHDHVHHHNEECNDPNCDCHHGEHHHENHEHHHADEVFESIGIETAKKFNKEFILSCLNALSESDKYGQVLRAKGIVEGDDGSWIHFDYVPGEPDIRTGSSAVIGRIVVIGAGINKEAVRELLGL